MKRVINVISFLLAVSGAVWFFQGIGVLQGSVMSNQTQWVIIGLLAVAVGVGVLYYTNRKRPA